MIIMIIDDAIIVFASLVGVYFSLGFSFNSKCRNEGKNALNVLDAHDCIFSSTSPSPELETSIN